MNHIFRAERGRRELRDLGFSLDQIPFFDTLDEREKMLILAGLSCRKYKRGESVFRTGTPPEKMYIVCSGRMKIYKFLPDGKEQILYIYSAGDFVGGFNMLEPEAYLYNASALETTVICTLDREAFDKVVSGNISMVKKILHKGIERLRWAEALADRLGQSSAEQKLAGLLLDLTPDFGRRSEEHLLLRLTLTREEMGSYAGLSRETVTRKLSQFQDDGLIKMEGNKIIDILDLGSLKRMAGRV